MNCFEDAFLNADARTEKSGSRTERAEAGPLRHGLVPDEPSVSAAKRFARRGLSEAEFRRSVLSNLNDIVTTTDLQSVIDLADLPHVSRSVLNHGIYDITHLTSDDANYADIERNIVAALMSYEPRLDRASVQVSRKTEFNDVVQKLRIAIHANATHHRHVVPIEFVAEIDLGASKVTISNAAGGV
ncbi:MAG: GPW/gp25 family protein [Rhizobiaceae bacterium]|nr:GPW/gp25 family protein [Rhizobiaceae bacterium]